MQINIDVEIFDDPEFCENEDVNCLFNGSNVVNGNCRCLLFGVDLESEQKTQNDFKCDQCKEAYKKSNGIKYSTTD